VKASKAQAKASFGVLDRELPQGEVEGFLPFSSLEDGSLEPGRCRSRRCVGSSIFATLPGPPYPSVPSFSPRR